MTNNNRIHKQGKDQPDTPLSVTGGSIIFDSEENQSPPWTITCCCVERKCEMPLFVLLLHDGIVLLVVTTSIAFLIFRPNENKSSIGVIAILAACPWYINPSPRQGTKLKALILAVFLRSLVPVVRKISCSCATSTTASPNFQTQFWTFCLLL